LKADSAHITCGIVCHNEEKNIESCLRGLFSGSNSEFLSEVIVVDNLSTDKTPEILRQWQREFPDKLRVHTAQKNLLGKSRQWIVDQTKTEFLLFTDGDCQIPSNWVKTHLDHFFSIPLSHSPAGVCGPNRLPENKVWQKAINQSLNSFLGHGFSPQAYRPTSKRRVNHLPTTNALFKVSCLRETSGFPPELMIGEDAHMGNQLRRVGHSMWLFPEPLVRNNCAESVQDWMARMFRFGRSRWHHSSKASAILFLCLLALVTVGTQLPVLGALMVALALSLWGSSLCLSLVPQKKLNEEVLNLPAEKNIRGLTLLCQLSTLGSYFWGWASYPLRGRKTF